MFNKFKQKIADGVEGVSVGRQNPTISRVHRNIKENKDTNGKDEVWREPTKRISHDSGTHTNSRSPNNTLEALLVDNGGSGNNAKIKSSPQEVLARVHHLIEVGRAQAQNNGRIEDGDGNVENETECDIAHIDTITSFSQDSNYTTSTPLEITQDELHEPMHLPSTEKHQSSIHETSHPDGALRSSNHRKTTQRGQQRKIPANHIVNTMPQSERGDGEGAPASPTANLSMGEMRELYHKQDSSLKRYKQKFGELVDAYKNLQKEKQKVEAIAREQESKRHGEITEREEELQGLKTQVNLLQSKRGDDRESEVGGGEEEYENVMDGVVQKMNQLVGEQEEMQVQACILRDELKNRDATIMTLRAEESRSDERLRNALKQQEMELQMLFEEKESQLKNLFADKVHDLQRMMEENEKQKKITLYQKETDVMRTKDELSILHEQLNECNERESKMKSKIDKIIVEKIECDKKLKDLVLQLQQEKEKQVEATNLNTKLLKEKQDETNEQISKMKRTSQLKVYELQDQLRKKTSELNETIEKHKVELDTKVKESTQVIQSEHAKATRKLENKVSDQKKMIKELRQKLTEKEGHCNKLEDNVASAKTEVEQAKSISATLLESEKKIGKLNWTIDNLNTEIEEWKRKHNELSASFDDVSIEKKGLEEKMTEKDVCIKELLNMANDDDKISTLSQQLDEERKRSSRLQKQLQEMMENTEDEEKTLQCELNNLKTKFSSVEEESRGVTQQLHNKVNEVEALSKTLETANKRLSLKDNDLKETRLLLDELQAKYESFHEEKQHFESEGNQTVVELTNCQETRLREEYERKMRERDEEFQEQLNKMRFAKETSLEMVTSQLEFAHQQELAALERRWKQECMTSTEELTAQLEGFQMKYCEYVEASEEERRQLVCEHEKEVRKLNHDVDALLQANEALRSEKNGSMGSILCDQDALKESLKRLKEREQELHLYIEDLSSKHEQEMDDLECRYKEQFITLNENYENMLNQYAREIETRLNENETNLDNKLHHLDKKCHQALLTNNSDDIKAIELKYLDEIQCLRKLVSCKEMENVENTKVIECLKHEVEESNTWLNDTTDRYEVELSKVNEKEQLARQCENELRYELEQCKSELLKSRTSFEEEISTLQAKVNDDESMIEELNAKIISIQINSNDMNDKMNELFEEKHELEQKLYNNQHFHENDEKTDKSNGRQTELNEYNVSPSKNTYETNPENQKLLELKRKTDLKINRLKQESRERIEVLESSRREIEEKVTVLERHVKEQQQFHEEEMARSLEEYQETLRCASEKFEAEFNVVNEELLTKCEKVIELEERLDNMTVDKMNSLNAQKVQLENEYNEIIRKVTDENKKEMATLEQHMLKEFQEASDVTQQTVQEASEVTEGSVKESSEMTQRNEKEIVEKYHQQILALEEELEKKEDALSNLQKDSEDQLEALHQQREDAEREREDAEREHNEEFAKLEGDYYEVTRRYETFLEKVAMKEKEAEEEESRMKRKIMEMEEKYLTKVEEMTENQKNELLAQEMKYKSQLKQAKAEMRKILISKGVLSPPSSTTDANPSVEEDPTSIDEVSSVCSNSDRPATLQLSHNHNGSLDISGHSDDLDTSPPKSPAPLEYEYLRNILYNYMMGKQCKQMAKVLTAIVHFTPVQVNEILTRVEEQEAKKEKKGSSWL